MAVKAPMAVTGSEGGVGTKGRSQLSQPEEERKLRRRR
jgi:hypothetical protein